MKTTLKITAALLLCAVTSIAALGCNTFRGAGRDIQKGGEAVENAADNVQYGDKN